MSIDLAKVFDLNRNVFIEACAGAGKTWLLSKRFAVIMDDFARQHAENPQQTPRDASNILVITFTRKAEAEMSARIYADLNQLLNDEAIKFTPEGFGSHLRNAPQAYKMHLRATYSHNAISTIDSFCTQVLREKAETLDIDPEFRIQDEADTQRMILETWERFLRERSRDQDPDLKQLLDHLSIHHLNEYIKKLQSHSELLQDWLAYHAEQTPDVLEGKFKANHPLPGFAEELESELAGLVKDLPEPMDILDSGHRQYLNMLATQAYLRAPSSEPYIHELNLIDFARRLALTSTGDKYLSSVRIPSKVWPTEFTPVLRERLKAFISFMPGLLPYEQLTQEIPTLWDITACRVHHHLARFYRNYSHAVSQRLKRENVLSFDEVIVRTHELLQDPLVAAHYGQRFSHILFDEFQDTNDLRWNIVRLIAQSGTPELRRQGLFIVGDTKQSIYRFNQADVQVMNRVRAQLENRGAWILTADETYRSSRRFVEDVINPLVSATFPGPEQQHAIQLYETHFTPSSAAESSPLSPEQHERTKCSVHAILQSEASSALDILRTGKLTQEWSTWLADHHLVKQDGPQIGILLRTFTHILDYIRVFTQLGLEFEVLSSKGLFSQQESFDIYHLISVLINPLDDSALVGLLRSPFFVVSDLEIQQIRDETPTSRRSGWCWQGLARVLPHIHETIALWQQRTAREPLDRIITSILGEADRRLGWISETGGLLRLENIKKLIHTIHSLSLDGLGLREVFEYFKYQIQHGDASQAELPGSAQIQILSIHKSKGLEFPVVILPELHSRPRSETSGMYLGSEAGNWEVGLSVDTLQETHKTWMYEHIKARSQAEEEAEDKRLFYVALTRAQYGVSFIARLDPRRKPASSSWWQRYIQPVFDLPLEKDDLLNDPQAVSAEWHNRSSDSREFELLLADDLQASSATNPAFSEIEFTDARRNEVGLAYEEISPHTIMTWMDPRSAAGSDERKKGEDLGLETSALTFGRLLHRVMEMEWFDLELHQENILQFLLNEGVNTDEEIEKLIDDLKGCLKIYRNSTLSNELAQLPGNHKLAELPVFGYLRRSDKIYKVNGIIDLLYRNGDEWTVLDYKTDKELPLNPEKKEYGYWYQIQTYLWMLRTLYGIQATGLLYFNRFDLRIPIEFEENEYFARLARIDQGKSLVPFLPSQTRPEPSLVDIIKRLDRNKTSIVIEPTRDSCERLSQYLAKEGLHFPTLQLFTLNELRKQLELSGRRLTPYLARLGVASLLGKRPHWGVVNRLAEAFYKATLGEHVVADKEVLYSDFLTWCSEHGIHPTQDDWDFSILGSDLQIIINSVHSTTPADYGFLQKLANAVDLIFMDPLRDNQPFPGFNMSIGQWSQQDRMPEDLSTHQFTVCYSVEEEVKLVAAQIRTLLDQEVNPEDIQIAVSSMERYVPIILRIFPEESISVRLSKREPVMERPVTHLAFALLQGRLAYKLSWDMAMAVWLHPLVCKPGAVLHQRQLLDVVVRKLGYTQLDSELPDLLKRQLNSQLGEQLAATATELISFVETTWYATQNMGLQDGAEWLLKILNDFEFTLRLDPGSVASKAYTSLKNAIEGVRKDWSIYLPGSGSLVDFNRELRERLKGVEVSSTQQGFGVDVISFLDSLNQHAPTLFVMGLTEGQFPVSQDSNPFLKATQLNPWFLNLHLFRTWLKYPSGQLFLSAPERDASGAALQISTFCQYLEQRAFPKLPKVSLSQQLRAATGKKIIAAHSAWQHRHNDLLDSPGQGKWFGALTPHEQRPFNMLSASAFDDLVKCPQRYWYSRKLKLEPAETDIAEREEIEVGNLVHQVLERFGKSNGFNIARTDLSAATEFLEKTALQYLKEAEIDPQADLLQSKWSELYFKNFQDPEKNLLTAMLYTEQAVLAAYPDGGLHEQAFGNGDDSESWSAYEIQDATLSLSLRGQIDRVFIGKDSVWATDYKTGAVNLNQTREFWTSQMLFYYLVLKARFPDKDVVLTYEQLKSFKDGAWGFKGYIGDTNSDHPVLNTVPPRSKATIPTDGSEEWSIQRIEAETLNYARYLAQNAFPLTDRNEKDACAYCLYERLCRKTALPR